MTELKLISVDDGTFLPLTAEFLARYSLKVGDSILLQEEPGQSLERFGDSGAE